MYMYMYIYIYIYIYVCVCVCVCMEMEIYIWRERDGAGRGDARRTLGRENRRFERCVVYVGHKNTDLSLATPELVIQF